jgi:hypothetical protein
MIKMEGMAPFNMVKGEIDVTLLDAERAIQKYMEDATDVSSLSTAIELLTQLLGVMRIISLDGAAFLIQDMLLLANSLLEKRVVEGQVDAALAVLGQSMIMLGHYVSFIHVRQKNLSILLVPTLNEIRRLLGLLFVSELDFAGFTIPTQHASDLFSRMPSDKVAVAEIPVRCRRLRSMYQVGLLGIIREQNKLTNLKIIYRAIERIARICGDVPLTRLWWVAAGSIQAFITGDVELTVARKIILRKIDTQLKKLVNEGVSFLNQQPPDDLFHDCMYVLAVSQSVPGLIDDLKNAYSLIEYPYKDSELRQEYLQMNGPSGSVIATVVMGLQEELLQIRETVEIGASGIAVETKHFSDASEALTRIVSTLVMLGLADAAAILKKQVQKLRDWSDLTTKPAELELQGMADALMQAENAIVTLKKRYIYDNIPHVSTPAVNVSISQIDEARLLVVGEARIGLSMTKKAIGAFLESEFKTEHIENVPTALHSVAGALQMLELDRAAKILLGCEQFMERYLTPSVQHPANANQFDIMADALASVDYYLEGMEALQPIGDGVLTVAEASIIEMGLASVSALPQD